MAKPTPSVAKPALLYWARTSARLSVAELAQAINQPPERVAAWESGAEAPTVAQLREVVRVARRPLAVFFLPSVPTDAPEAPEFRRLLGAPSMPSLGLRRALRLASERREAFLEAGRLLGDAPEPFPERADPGEGSDELAHRVRQVLGVSLDDQWATRSDYEALNLWRDAAERAGTLVMQMTGVEVEEARGFSLPMDLLPVVAVSSKDSPHGRVFTLLDELAHVARRAGGICAIDADVADYLGAKIDHIDKIETELSRVAHRR